VDEIALTAAPAAAGLVESEEDAARRGRKRSTPRELLSGKGVAGETRSMARADEAQGKLYQPGARRTWKTG